MNRLTCPKSYNLYTTTIGVWLIAVGLAFPSLLFRTKSDVFAQYNLYFHYFAITSLLYFWFFSSYHLTAFMIWFFRQPHSSARVAIDLQTPPVALFYTICNDFLKDCAEKNLSLNYPNYHLFLCDDSTDLSTKRNVDEFRRLHSNRCSIIRRQDRTGFKSGNLNYALEYIEDKYDYIVLADNDSIIGRDFICACLTHFFNNQQLAFIQGTHVAGPGDYTRKFSSDLALGVECLYKFISLKNSYGLVPMMGHGAMLRTAALRQVGGFPIRVSEDLSLTTKFRMEGYYGYVLTQIVCSEGLPRTFSQFRRRLEKWLIGGIEFLKRDSIDFICSSKVPVIERFDLIFHLFSLMNVISLGIFILVVNVAWPILYGTWRISTVDLNFINLFIGLPFLDLPIFHAIQVNSASRVIIVIAILAPLSYFIPELRRRPVQTLRHVSTAFTCFCSFLVPSLITLLTVLISGKYEFRSTSDSLEERLWMVGRQNLHRNFYVGRLASVAIECVVGIGVLWLAIVTWNIFLLSMAFGICFGPLCTFFSWENHLISWIKHLPFSLLMIQLVFVSLPILGYMGITSNIVMIHF